MNTNPATPAEAPPEDGSRLAVLGAGGRLGRILRRAWAGRPGTVWQTRQDLPGTARLDPLSDPAGLASLAARADAILCLAGATIGDPSVNSALARAAILAARPGARVILCSSAAVYGDGDGIWHETATPNPVGAYGRAKLGMERLAVGLRPDIRLTILRIGNVAGADAILGGWRPGFALDVLRDGRTPRRSYVGPGAFAAILAEVLARRDLPDLINFALPADVEMGDLLDHAGMDWTARAAAPDCIARVCLDVTRLQDVLGRRLAPATAAAIVADFRAFST